MNARRKVCRIRKARDRGDPLDADGGLFQVLRPLAIEFSPTASASTPSRQVRWKASAYALPELACSGAT